MMKAHHGCSQLIFDHNQKQNRKTLGGSLPSTPRNNSLSNVSRHTTPREENSEFSGFGLPQAEQDAGKNDAYCRVW